MAETNDDTGTNTKHKEVESTEKEDGIDEDVNIFPCSVCSATFVTEISLSRHMFIHEDNEEDQDNNDSTQICQNIYEEELSSHSMDNIGLDTEETSPLPNVPTMLEAILKRKPTMDMESSATEPHLPLAKMPKLQANARPIPNLKPLPPLISKQEFEMALQLKRFVCDTCGVSFNKKEDLSRHVTRTHGGARFTCPYCQRNISRRDHLKRHIKNVHPEYCTDTEIGPFLADPNASRAAKEQHAENFVAQYVMPDIYGEPSLSLYEELQNNAPQHANAHSILQTQLLGQHDLKYNDVNLEEEGDDEFEGEEEPEENGSQQITVEPELPPQDYDEEYHDQKYEDSNQLSLIEIQRKLAQHNLALSNEANNLIGYRTSPINVLNQRKETHVIERKFKCETCGAAFMSKINLQRHVSTHSIVRPHKCSLCGKGFLRKEHLTKHLSSVHSGMKFTCQFCNKDISRKDHLLRHIRNCHPAEFMGMPPELLVQQQQVSQIKFESPHSNPKSWNNNIKNQPTEKQTLLACDICFETFYHIDELNEHQSSVHSDVWKFKCLHCTKAFKRKEHLTKHQVLHSAEKRFGCSICRKVFNQKDKVYEHIRSVHGDTETNHETFPCNLCDKVFKQKSLINQHLKVYHGVSHSTDENGIYATQATIKKPTPPPKMNFAKLQSLGIDVTTSRQIDGNIGSLMGLINKGSLSVSTVNSSGQ